MSNPSTTAPAPVTYDQGTVQILQSLATVNEKLNGIGEKIRDHGDSIKNNANNAVALEKALNERITATEKASEERFAANNKAVDERFAAHNKVVEDRLSAIEKLLQSYTDRFMGGKTVVGIFSGACGIVFGAFMFWMKFGMPGVH